MRVREFFAVDDALEWAVETLTSSNEPIVRRDSRNGPVLMLDKPMATVYEFPQYRVLFRPERDANPFFHFYESLWMLAGRSDVESLTRYVPRMASFSDDGESFNAAYGARWRSQNGGNQLAVIIDKLRVNPDDRRCVLQIWDAQSDLWDHGADTPYSGKDAACNLTITFQTNALGQLCMVVFCRSNDVIWGAYGANAVHFSMLMEYVARHAGLKLGTYTQISVNWHAYVDILEPLARKMSARRWQRIPYDHVEPFPIVSPGVTRDVWDDLCEKITSGRGRLPEISRSEFEPEPFFHDVAWPMIAAHDAWKSDASRAERFHEAFTLLNQCEAQDWRMAAQEWLERRREKENK